MRRLRWTSERRKDGHEGSIERDDGSAAKYISR